MIDLIMFINSIDLIIDLATDTFHQVIPYKNHTLIIIINSLNILYIDIYIFQYE